MVGSDRNLGNWKLSRRQRSRNVVMGGGSGRLIGCACDAGAVAASRATFGIPPWQVGPLCHPSPSHTLPSPAQFHKLQHTITESLDSCPSTQFIDFNRCNAI